jgi:hypothetical protein
MLGIWLALPPLPPSTTTSGDYRFPPPPSAATTDDDEFPDVPQIELGPSAILGETVPMDSALERALGLTEPSAATTQDLHRQTLVSWPDPLTMPRVTARCVKEASMTGFECERFKCGRTIWKTCIGHAYDIEHMQCELFLRVPTLENLPANLANSARNVARVCAGISLGGCGVIAATATPASALACLQPAFLACVKSRGSEALSTLSIAVDESCGWRK